MSNSALTVNKRLHSEAMPSPSEAAQSSPRLRVNSRAGNLQTPSSPAHNEPGQAIRRILVPIDFSSNTANALNHALRAARPEQATITLLHVIDVASPLAQTHSGTAEEWTRQLWATGISQLLRLKNSLEPTGLSIQMVLAEGLPSEEIVEHSSGFDLLVISKPEPKSALNFFRSRTAQRVMAGARCPVEMTGENGCTTGRRVLAKAKTGAA